MRRLALLAALVALALPTVASAHGTAAGARHALARFLRHEGRHVMASAPFGMITCTAIAPARFGCSFMEKERPVKVGGIVLTGGGVLRAVTVSYTRGRYHVGKLRFEKPPQVLEPCSKPKTKGC